MHINIEYEYDEPLDFDYEKVASDVLEAVMDYENCPYEAEANLILTDADTVRQTNKEYRQIDSETDVLSFPMIAFSKPSFFDEAEEMDDCFHPDTGELLLGDIMISVPRMKQQALEYGHSILREYAFLITHSLLHLVGYDHMVLEEAAVMEQKQREILENLQITRE